MKIKLVCFLILCASILAFSSFALANGWQLKDMGVGIYDDAAYDTELRIVEKRSTWSLKELQSRGSSDRTRQGIRRLAGWSSCQHVSESLRTGRVSL